MIVHYPISERPRERLRHAGPESLSLRELIALVLGSGPPAKGCIGLAGDVLARSATTLGSWEEELAFFRGMEAASFDHLQGIKGLGAAGIARLCAAFELGRRYARFRLQSDGVAALGGEFDLESLELDALSRVQPHQRGAVHEWLGFVPLFNSGLLGDLCIVERGTASQVYVDIRELFARILALRALAVFLFHNHPSGRMQASRADRDLTTRVQGLLDVFGVGLLGHFIVSTNRQVRI